MPQLNKSKVVRPQEFIWQLVAELLARMDAIRGRT
jgi:hypothetical protein